MPSLADVRSLESGRSAADPVAAARRLARSFRADAAAIDAAGRLPFGNLQLLREAGLLRLVVPKELGGAGGDLRSALAAARVLAQGEPATALILAMHHIQHGIIHTSASWPLPLRELLARTAIEEGALVNALRVEPELGTPQRGGLPATVAKRSGDGWRLSGRKIFSTGSSALRWMVVWARTDEEQPRVGQFLVDARSPGIHIEPSWDHLGMRASGSDDVVFEATPLPLNAAAELRDPAEWTAPSPIATAWITLVVAGLYHGIAEAALDWLAGWLDERRPANLGHNLASLPRFQEATGRLLARLQASEALLELWSERAVASPESLDPAALGLVKQTVTGNAILVVQEAVALSGNPGLTRRNPLERHLRDVLCGRVHSPQDDSASRAAGKAFLDRLAKREEEA